MPPPPPPPVIPAAMHANWAAALRSPSRAVACAPPLVLSCDPGLPMYKLPQYQGEGGVSRYFNWSPHLNLQLLLCCLCPWIWVDIPRKLCWLAVRLLPRLDSPAAMLVALVTVLPAIDDQRKPAENSLSLHVNSTVISYTVKPPLSGLP